MKTIIKTVLSVIMITATFNSVAQDKKTHNFTVKRIIQASADDVWAIVGEDFGGIAKSHPKIVSSEYNQGHITGGEGASRTCNYNASGTKYVQEKQLEYNAENRTFTVQVYHSEKLPLDAENSKAVYTVNRIDDNSCELVFEMQYRTKPAFLGGLAKGKFKKTIEDYEIAVEHHVLTGEEVNQENFKEIKKKYKS